MRETTCLPYKRQEIKDAEVDSGWIALWILKGMHTLCVYSTGAGLYLRRYEVPEWTQGLGKPA